MVEIPSPRRSETAPVRDENRDGRLDERDAPAADTVATGARTTTMDRVRDADRTRPVTERPMTRKPADREQAAGRAAVRPTVGRADRADPTDPADPADPAETTGGREPVAVVPGPKPRASLLATLGLVVGVVAVLFVLTGTLAGYGIALGALALPLSVGGVSATGRRHIAGKPDAVIGLALGLGAVVLGILAVTGDFAWPNADTDTVQRFREWLDTQLVDRF